MRRRSPVRDWLEYLAVRLLFLSLEWTPRSVADGLARCYVKLVDLAVPRFRRVARRNLEIAFPQMGTAERERIADGVFRSIARLLVVFARFPRIHKGNVSEWIRYDGLENFQEAKRRGRGVLFATGHLGGWELSAYSHGIMTEPMHVVVRSLDNPLLDGLVERRRRFRGNGVIEKKRVARGIFRALAANEAVGILIDQNSTPEEGVFVEFFGVPACASVGFAKIAARAKTTVIPVFALWSDEERRYLLRFYPPFEMTGDAEEDTRRLHRFFEDTIRRYPDQWLWIHRRWKTRPPGEPPLY